MWGWRGGWGLWLLGGLARAPQGGRTQQPWFPGEVGQLTQPAPWPATCSGHVVPRRPRWPEAPASCSRGRWSPPWPGEERKNPSCQRVLPVYGFGPAPWCSHCAIWLSLLWPNPRRLPPSFREGLFAVKTQVWGRSM